MPPQSDRSIRELISEVNDLAQTVLAQVNAFVTGRSGSAQAIEQTVIRGLNLSAEAVQQLSLLVESSRLSRDDAEAIGEALAQADQRLAFFQGCTMRRSSAPSARDGDEAEDYAAEAESLAADARSMPGIYELVQAYKRVEALEARVIELRGAAKSGSGPEPRVLDLPRARVLAARRAIGGAITNMDPAD